MSSLAWWSSRCVSKHVLSKRMFFCTHAAV